MSYFMEDAVKKADKVILILTENYKAKADSRKGGVGYEYSIINTELYRNQIENVKFLPVLKSGKREDSTPIFLQSFVSLDLSNPDSFDEEYEKLLREL